MSFFYAVCGTVAQFGIRLLVARRLSDCDTLSVKMADKWAVLALFMCHNCDFSAYFMFGIAFVYSYATASRRFVVRKFSEKRK
jgi:hypothetical protein